MLIIFYCFTSHVYYFQVKIYNKTIIGFSLWVSPLEMYRFSFCDMLNYQCLGKSYQPRLRLGTLTSTLIILHITKTSSNNCLFNVTRAITRHLTREISFEISCFRVDFMNISIFTPPPPPYRTYSGPEC